jgi:hypothetical protein
VTNAERKAKFDRLRAEWIALDEAFRELLYTSNRAQICKAQAEAEAAWERLNKAAS